MGIKYVDFDANNQIPPKFYDSSAILITAVQKLFNGLSVFGVAGRPDPVKAGVTLVDDAHTYTDIANEQFSVKIPMNSDIGKRIYNFFEAALEYQSVGFNADIGNGERNSFIRVPYWAWVERLANLAEIFSRGLDSEGI